VVLNDFWGGAGVFPRYRTSMRVLTCGTNRATGFARAHEMGVGRVYLLPDVPESMRPEIAAPKYR
jgi:hypothetical protein